MNPTEQKIRRHEIDRVSKMSDRQLSTRYGKMSDKKKIEAFYSVLKDEKRNDVLQQRIGQDYPELVHTVVDQHSKVHIIVHPAHDDGMEVCFSEIRNEKNGPAVSVIITFADGKRQTETVEDARIIWDKHMNTGWRLKD
jgi:hypothetical protein